MTEFQWPKISVVTPSLNQGTYLEYTIQSVLNQNYPNLEYIIIDGGSTDNSLKIIKKYEKYLSFWCSEPDNGHYHAVNKGFKKATGQICAWLNSDDLYCPWCFESVATIFMQYPQVKWLTTLYQIVWNSKGLCARVKRIPGYSLHAFLDGYYINGRQYAFGFIQQESTFWHKSLWDLCGGIRTEFKLAGDFDLWARFFLHENLYGVETPLGGFRSHSYNRSKNSKAYINEALESLGQINNYSNHIISSSKRNLSKKFLAPLKNFYLFSPFRKIIIPYISRNIKLSTSQNCSKWYIYTVKY